MEYDRCKGERKLLLQKMNVALTHIVVELNKCQGILFFHVLSVALIHNKNYICRLFQSLGINQCPSFSKQCVIGKPGFPPNSAQTLLEFGNTKWLNLNKWKRKESESSKIIGKGTWRHTPGWSPHCSRWIWGAIELLKVKMDRKWKWKDQAKIPGNTLLLAN